MGRNIVAVLALGGLATGLAVLAQTAGETIQIRQPIGTDFYAAAQEIDIGAEIDGDLVAAAQRISVSSAVAGDVIAAGELVVLKGQVEDDVRVAGRWVRVEAPISGHLVAAGARVEIDPAVTVGDWAWLAGRRIVMAGSLGGGLKAVGQEVVVRGRVGADADLEAESIRIEQGAVIEGDLIWRGEREPAIAAGAQIDGRLVQMPPREWGDGEARERGIGSALVFAASLILAALGFYALFSSFSIEAAQATRSHFWPSLGLGFLFCFGVPVVALVAFVTVIGAAVGLALLAAYLLALLLGAAAALIAVGDVGLKLARRAAPGWGWRLLSFIVAAVVLMLVGWIPWIGGLAVLLVWVTALGALLWQAGQRYRQPA